MRAARRSVPLAALLAAAVAAAVAAAARAEEEKPAIETLRSGVAITRFVATDADDEASARTYRFNVPADAVRIRLDLEGRADVNLYVARHPIADYEKDPVASSASETATERVVIDRDGQPALETGEYFAVVAFQRDTPPALATGKPLGRVEFKLKLEVLRTRVDGALAPGKPLSGLIDPKDGSFRTYTVDVPSGAKVLRFDLTGAPADLDLRARRGKPMVEAADADARAASPVGTEALIVEGDGDGRLEGRWYVDVTDSNALEFTIPFTLRVSFERAPDPSLLVFPSLPAPKTPIERALFSTVELIGNEAGGSGVLISEKGWILTNYHVVQEEVEGKGLIGDRIVVALTVDPRDPPHELFRAKVVAGEPDLDLALLRCETGLYGQPIPGGFRFPVAALGAPERLSVGDPLFCVGYPTAGGSGSRVSVTFTRGVIAGFERRGATLHLKTDAEINAGNSGGAACNERFEAIGIPTETIGDEGEDARGQIGYIRPLWLVPADWWSKAGAAPPRK